jgi:uncharacterized repeat protein (TIGR01451 family)
VELVVLAGFVAPVFAQQAPPANITTVAGGGPATMPKLNGSVSNVASTGEVGQIAYDPAHGVFYFTSSTFNRIFKFDPVARQATAIAGTGFTGFSGDGGSALQATFAGPLGLALDPTNPNLLYVADTGNNRVRRVDLSTGTVDTISGDGTCITALLTYTDAPTATANICAPGQLAMDGNGVLYAFDLTRRVVWRMAGGQARMIAGSSAASRPIVPVPPGIATTMPLGDFGYLAADLAGQFLYINETIGLRQLNLTTGVLSVPIDVSANQPFLDQFGAPTGFFIPLQRVGSPVAVDPATGNVIYAIYEQAASSESIFSYSPTSGLKTFIAGKGSTSPAFLPPTSDVNLGAMNNGLGELVAIATGGSAGTFVASRSGWIHSMDSLSLGANFATILGNGFRSYCGDGGPATSACLDSPSSVSANPDGSFFIADKGNSVVRFVDTNGIIHSLTSPKAAGAPPHSLAVIPAGVTNNQPFAFLPPPGSVLFTSIAKRQVFALDPAADKTTRYSGDGNDACQFLQGNGFCDLHEDFGLGGAEYNQPRGLVVDQFGNPFLAEPNVDGGNGPIGAIACLICDDSIVTLFGLDPNTFAKIHDFGNPDALAVDSDGLLVAEKGAQKIQHLTAAQGFNGVRTGFSGWIDTDILNNRQLPLPNVTPFTPVGVARTPGHVVAADDYNRIVWSATRPTDFGPCPQGATCIIPPTPPQVVAAFAGGGTLYQDNVPAYQAAFGFRQVEAGIFDPLDSFGELASADVGSNSLVYITDRADNRIRMVATGGNHAPVADAGIDRNVPLDSLSTIATVLLDGSASSDPDGDTLTYAWTENGTALGTGAFVQTRLALGKHPVTLTVADSFGATSSVTVNITVTPPVDLTIVATPSATTVSVGGALTYSATVTNNGPNTATGVSVTLPLLSTTDFVSGTASGGACTGPASGTAGVVTCAVGNLANGATANISINVKPNAAGTLASVLSVSGDQGDPNTTNNSVTVSVTVNALAAVPVIVNETIHVTDVVTPLPSVMLPVAETIHVNDAATPLPSVMLPVAETIHITDTPGVTPVANTPVGSSTVVPPDQNGNPSNVTVTFAGGVTASGFTSVNISPIGPALPAGFLLGGNPPVYYDVQTTAQFNPPVVVCVPLSPVPFGAAFLHFNAATQQWEDFTVRPVPSIGPICTQVNSLSPFAVVVPSNHPPTANGGTNQIVEATGPAGAPVTLSGSGSDPDNDPLTFTWSESGSTIGTGAQITVTFPIGLHNITLTADDGRGGTGSSTVMIIVRDTIAPKITCASPDTAWHATDVSISCTAGDSGSGLANSADASFSLSTSVGVGTETSTAQTGTRTVCDVAGNCSVAGPIGPIKVDKKGPTVTLIAPANGSVYLLNQSVAVNFSCADRGSGLTSCSGTVASGGSLDTSSVGSKSFTVTATDAVGNKTLVTNNYTVTYAPSGICGGDAGHQILQPINADGTSVWKQGRTVPAKFRVCDAKGVSIGTPGVVTNFALVQIISGTATDVDETASSTSADSAFHWDATAQQWIFNISTSNLTAGSTYVFRVQLNDGSSISFGFGLR